MAVINITKDNFQQEVVAASQTVLVDFWATWCGPCQMMGPILEELATKHPEIKVGKSMWTNSQSWQRNSR